MQVELINAPNWRHAMEKMCFIYETCYNKYATWRTRKMENASIEEMSEYLSKRLGEKHMNGFEAITLTFHIKHVSRVLSHQLVRHRHASFSQLSQRYSAEDQINLVLPVGIKNNNEAIKVVKEMERATQKGLDKLIKLGIHKEDYRYLVPQGQSTNLMLSVNLHALLKIAEIRLCTLTQKEFWILMRQIRSLVVKEYPFLAKHFVIKCQKSGFCDETRNSNNDICKIKPYKKPEYLIDL